MTQEDRWRQRFESFSRALALLREALSLPESDLSDLEREGLVQRFHYTYELAWRVIKDRLDHEGIVLENETPRRVVREAFAAGLLKDGETWMDMIGDRNLTVHTYAAARFEAVVAKVRSHYISAFEALYETLGAQESKS